jgi:hypothetical protein
MCRRELVVRGELDGHSVVGEECHIVSPRPLGRRYGEEVPGGDLDGYDNLLLLCGGDHALIDDAVAEYPVKRLCDIKAAHEVWWKTSLAKKPEPVKVRYGKVSFVPEITDARDLLYIVVGAQMSSLESEDPADEEELDLVSRFIQDLQDYADIWDGWEPASRMRAIFEIRRELEDVQANGWRAFGARAPGTITGGDGPPSNWDTAYVRLVRHDSPLITKSDSPTID